MSPIRYPLAPLAKALHIELGETLHGGQQPGDEPAGLHALAEAVHVSISTAQRFRRFGLTERAADRLATAAGMHPSSLWPSWWADAAGEDDAWYSDDPPMSAPILQAAS
jgi:hypothetical protein